ncbi:MAG: hypothetical protein WHU94_13510 [Thermogemmata sp.]|jgi:hypothetical protein|uniref:Uncharacterized protein n=1 Tax=Thermogemmata fonticola TaxID=2755323 RepID=A0A7V8VEV9_9BACT|nr:hypothetical protein [Thermogemmata fonticola]MBA2226754.1 hypothetical protein [Thermogemmata fonticola]MCX8139103.1 hypothetical protein [Gemmataceae bacterium]
MTNMAKRWHYVTGGQRYGPVSDAESGGIGLYLLVFSGMGLAGVAWLLAGPATDEG